MYATDELLLDTAQFNAVAKQSAGEELNFMLNDDIVNGLGSAGAKGFLVTPGPLVSFARVDANKIQHADIIAMWMHMLPRSRAGANWYANSEVQTQLDALYFTGVTSVLSPYVSYGQDGVMRMYGRPVLYTEFNPGLGLLGDLVLADLNEYLLWEKGDVQSATSIHIAFLTDEMAFRFILRADGQTSNYSAITPYKTNTSLTQSSFVALTAAS